MDIIRNGEISHEFLEGMGKSNCDRILKAAAGNERPKAVSKKLLDDKLRDLKIPFSIAKLRELIWVEDDDEKLSHFHIFVGKLLKATSSDILNVENQYKGLKLESDKMIDCSTNEIIDVRFTENQLEVAFVAEGNVEIRQEEMDSTEHVGKCDFLYKAYRLVDVPLVSNGTLDGQDISVVFRPFHANTSINKNYLQALKIIEERMNVSIVAVAGIDTQLQKLLIANKLVIKDISAIDIGDGSRASLKRSLGIQSENTETISEGLRVWLPENGRFQYKTTYNGEEILADFRVNCKTGIFTFLQAKRLTVLQSKEIINEILGY